MVESNRAALITVLASAGMILLFVSSPLTVLLFLAYVPFTERLIIAAVQNRELFLLLQAMSIVLTVVPILLLVVKFMIRAPVLEYLGFRRVSLRNVLRWTGLLFLVYLGGDLILVASGEPLVSVQEQEKYLGASYPLSLWITYVVLYPLAEELLYRGFMFRGIERTALGPNGAIGITLVLWTMMHGGKLHEILIILCIGLVVSFARKATGSVVSSLVVHIMSNTITMIEIHWLTNWAS